MSKKDTSNIVIRPDFQMIDSLEKNKQKLYFVGGVLGEVDLSEEAIAGAKQIIFDACEALETAINIIR